MVVSEANLLHNSYKTTTLHTEHQCLSLMMAITINSQCLQLDLYQISAPALAEIHLLSRISPKSGSG